MRVACYIDGFNLYHAIKDLGDQRLKWINLRSLAESYLRLGDVLVRTVFFTAINEWDQEKRQRHVAFLKALEANGVEIVRSHFAKTKKFCFVNSRYCNNREEKQTDVAIAIDTLSDCYELGIERILLITADSDQVPMVRRVRQRFPQTIVYLIAPPKRLTVARDLGKECSGITELTIGRMLQHPLPPEIRDGAGQLIVARPALYGNHV